MRRGILSKRDAPGKDERAKYKPGKDPLEKEESIAIIKPQNKQQREAVLKMLNDVEQKAQNDPIAKQAIAMWKTQYEMNQLQDSVDYGFLRDWWYWLLGRASDKDAARTLWGRANVAAHNDEVAAYIELFVNKRLDYALKLISLANRVPDTLNEYYLYFKYVVRGNIERKEKDGHTYYDLKNEDFLNDWDLLFRTFDSEALAKESIQGPLRKQGTSIDGHVPYPSTDAERAQWKVDDFITRAIKGIETEMETRATKETREQLEREQQERDDLDNKIDDHIGKLRVQHGLLEKFDDVNANSKQINAEADRLEKISAKLETDKGIQTLHDRVDHMANNHREVPRGWSLAKWNRINDQHRGLIKDADDEAERLRNEATKKEAFEKAKEQQEKEEEELKKEFEKRKSMETEDIQPSQAKLEQFDLQTDFEAYEEQQRQEAEDEKQQKETQGPMELVEKDELTEEQKRKADEADKKEEEKARLKKEAEEAKKKAEEEKKKEAEEKARLKKEAAERRERENLRKEKEKAEKAAAAAEKRRLAAEEKEHKAKVAETERLRKAEEANQKREAELLKKQEEVNKKKTAAMLKIAKEQKRATDAKRKAQKLAEERENNDEAHVPEVPRSTATKKTRKRTKKKDTLEKELAKHTTVRPRKKEIKKELAVIKEEERKEKTRSEAPEDIEQIDAKSKSQKKKLKSGKDIKQIKAKDDKGKEEEGPLPRDQIKRTLGKSPDDMLKKTRQHNVRQMKNPDLSEARKVQLAQQNEIIKEILEKRRKRTQALKKMYMGIKNNDTLRKAQITIEKELSSKKLSDDEREDREKRIQIIKRTLSQRAKRDRAASKKPTVTKKVKTTKETQLRAKHPTVAKAKGAPASKKTKKEEEDNN